MTDIDSWQIVKWVLLVLAAGFIGQFGKSFAEHLIKRSRKKTSPSVAGEAETAGEKTATDLLRRPGSDPKAEKKALKAMAKLRKKDR